MIEIQYCLAHLCKKTTIANTLTVIESVKIYGLNFICLRAWIFMWIDKFSCITWSGFLEYECMIMKNIMFLF
jgi:hypothetical protein